MSVFVCDKVRPFKRDDNRSYQYSLYKDYNLYIEIYGQPLGARFWSCLINSQHVFYQVQNHSSFALVVLNLIKHCCSFIKLYLYNFYFNLTKSTFDIFDPRTFKTVCIKYHSFWSIGNILVNVLVCMYQIPLSLVNVVASRPYFH